MTSFDVYKSTDYSPFLIHLTRDTGPGKGTITGNRFMGSEHELHPFLNSSAMDKLTAILRTGIVKSAPQPDLPNQPEAACFSETVWGSLEILTGSFSSYGVGFKKRFVFERGGGPALYTRGDVLREWSDEIPSQLLPFMKPFDPDGSWLSERSNFLYEREWRIPQDLQFGFGDIQFVLVDTYRDAEIIVQRFGPENIPYDQLIVMESHRKVKDTWGGHFR